MTKYLRNSRLLLTGVALAVSALLPRSAKAQQLIGNIASVSNTVSWNAVVDPSSTTALVTYTLHRKSGISNNPLVGGTSFVTTNTSIGFGGRMSQSYCFVVEASDSVSGTFNTSAIFCHSFLHDTGGGNNNAIIRSDGGGTQIDFNQIWNMDYYLDSDAYVVLNIYPPNETFTVDPNTGFSTPNNNAPITTVIADGSSRSGELNSTPVNKTHEFWDNRNSSGVTVPNGIYTAWFNVYLPSLFGGTTVYSSVFTLPVDTRFTSFATTGITPTVTLANINYFISSNSSVRIVIAKPGRQFTIDASGDVQALDATNTVIDTSTGSVVRVITPTPGAGANTTTWDGLNSLGVAVSSGVYAIGVSAKDGFGNRALDLSGHNGPVQGTIPVDRIPAQGAAGGPAPSVSAITVGGTSINTLGGTSVSLANPINITLSATGGPATTVSLTGPGGLIAGGLVTVSGTAVSYSTTAVLTATGTYTLAIAPFDLSGTVPGPVLNTTFVLPAGGAGAAPGTTQTNASFAAALIPAPNPAKTSANIMFNLPVASNVTIDIYTLTGHRVLHQINSYPAGAQFYTWGLVNDAGSTIANGVYIARVTATNSLGTVHATKKIMVVK